jgi:hypothetical protein
MCLLVKEFLILIKRRNIMFKKSLLLLSLVFIISGCEWGHVPTGNFSTRPTNLNPYGSRLLDGNGIIYTKRAGTIDPDHIWGCGRVTFSAYNDICSNLMKNSAEFTTQGKDVKNIKYPSNWESLSEQEKTIIAQNVALELAETIGFHSKIYHELNTFWGFSIDYESSFSWEDLYSDAFGAKLAMQAQKMEIEGKGKATKIITDLTNQFMIDNQAVSAKRAKEVVDSLEGHGFWRKRPIQRKLLARNLSVGADGYINPTPIPNFTIEPLTRLKAPRTDFSNIHGFSFDVYVNPWAPQYSRARNLLGIDRQISIKDHPRLMQLIEKECLAKGYLVFK